MLWALKYSKLLVNELITFYRAGLDCSYKRVALFLIWLVAFKHVRIHFLKILFFDPYKAVYLEVQLWSKTVYTPRKEWNNYLSFREDLKD